MSGTGDVPTYSFHCPFCREAWRLDEFVTLSAALFASFDGWSECPRCHGRFSWVKPGEMIGELDGKPWWEALKGRPRTKPGRCKHCGRRIEGSKWRLYCSPTCRSMSYYRRRHPTIHFEKKKF